MITANSGVEAMQKLKSSLANLVILDIRMSELERVETLKHIMERPSKPPIILNSSYTAKTTSSPGLPRPTSSSPTSAS